jgi:crotonobetainyl-CoA:carnitine CoA-transferase CaiB-like acyl-CoA transferase
VLFRRTGVECCDVAMADTTLAWRSNGAVDVFDLATRRLRFRAAPPAGAPIAAFDVQADGKLAMLVGRQPDGHTTLVDAMLLSSRVMACR